MLDYIFGDMVAIAMIFAVIYWPVILALMVLPPIVGYLLDRRASRHT
jgi:hypothetical protein